MRLILQLVLPADARLLRRTRRAIAEYLAEVDAKPEHVDDVILALDEACTNVVRHAYDPGEEGCFRLVAEITDDTVCIEVEDDGRGLPEGGTIDLTDDHGATSGRGLRLIHELMTSVEVASPTERGSGTRLRMEKRLSHSA